MFQYYKDAGQLPIDADIEAMIREMKPWYNNYCFAEESLERDPKMFNCDMVLTTCAITSRWANLLKR